MSIILHKWLDEEWVLRNNLMREENNNDFETKFDVLIWLSRRAIFYETD